MIVQVPTSQMVMFRIAKVVGTDPTLLASNAKFAVKAAKSRVAKSGRALVTMASLSPFHRNLTRYLRRRRKMVRRKLKKQESSPFGVIRIVT